METFQKLTVELPLDKVELFYDYLSQKINNSQDWSLRNDLAANFIKNSFTKSKYVITAESNEFLLGNRTIRGVVWLWNDQNVFKVNNIIPSGSVRNLETNEYNYILGEFKRDFIDNVPNNLEAKVNLTNASKLIEDTIGEDGLAALKSFSDGANKTTGNTNPYDFQRWCEFIFIIYRTETSLSSTELEKWLIENGWDDEMALKLSLEFDYSIELLGKYEQSR
ncbi:MAG: hypothetical protein BGO31_12750 [Bacteroidetes bacterium 43-16]|nr:MAG: hypothetical protein BGO31_12750 [Bacteroidetes bacterium 43-16]